MSLPCSVTSCNEYVTEKSKTGLCKKHYSYLWKSNNKVKAATHCKTTYTRNRDKYVKSSAERRTLARQSDPIVRLRDSLRRRLNNALKNVQKTGSAVDDLGCSIEDLKIYLESRFEVGMTWENYGQFGWHIDHIKPLSLYNLADVEQLRQACHYTNLQPLWWRPNLIKGAKYG